MNFRRFMSNPYGFITVGNYEIKVDNDGNKSYLMESVSHDRLISLICDNEPIYSLLYYRRYVNNGTRIRFLFLLENDSAQNPDTDRVMERMANKLDIIKRVADEVEIIIAPHDGIDEEASRKITWSLASRRYGSRNCEERTFHLERSLEGPFSGIHAGSYIKIYAYQSGKINIRVRNEKWINPNTFGVYSGIYGSHTQQFMYDYFMRVRGNISPTYAKDWYNHKEGHTVYEGFISDVVPNMVKAAKC